MLLGGKLVIIGLLSSFFHERVKKILHLHLCSFKWFQNNINWGVKFKVVVGLVTKKKQILKAMMPTHSVTHTFLGFRKIIQAPFHFTPAVVNFSYHSGKYLICNKISPGSNTPLHHVHCNFLSFIILLIC